MESIIYNRSFSFFKGVLGSLLLLSLVACSGEQEEAKQDVRTVRVATVSEASVLLQRRFTGRVDAVSTIDLSFQVPGRLVEFPAREGVLIPKGQLIAALGKHDFQLVLEQAQAQFEQAKLDVGRKRNLQRSGSLPKAMLDQAETAFKLSQVALKTAQRNLAYTRITAPFDALVSNRLIDNYTNVGAFQRIVRVHDLTELRVSINIPEQLVRLLERTEDFNAVAMFKGRPGELFPLEYREHISEAGRVAQTFEVVFGLPREKHQHILPGMTVVVMISKKSADEKTQFMIPVSAVDYDAKGAARVWIFDEKTNKVTPRSVTLGNIKKSQIIVLSGLTLGEKIVTAGAHLLSDGMPVRRFVSF